MMDQLFSADLAVTALVSALSLLAVWVPFMRGLRLCVRASNATRRVTRGELQATGDGAKRELDSFGMLMLRVLHRALHDNRQQGHPSEFVLDATKQYVVHEYESHYQRMISMYANILPPIGFIGTTCGMLILFFSMHLGNESLELGALALALVSSIFALIGFAILEALKIRLYGRLLTCLDDATAFQQAAGRAKAGQAAPAAAG